MFVAAFDDNLDRFRCGAFIVRRRTLRHLQAANGCIRKRAKIRTFVDPLSAPPWSTRDRINKSQVEVRCQCHPDNIGNRFLELLTAQIP